jgi:hypothetical protein
VSCPVTRAGSFTLASQHQQERNYQFQKELTVSPHEC